MIPTLASKRITPQWNFGRTSAPEGILYANFCQLDLKTSAVVSVTSVEGTSAWDIQDSFSAIRMISHPWFWSCGSVEFIFPGAHVFFCKSSLFGFLAAVLLFLHLCASAVGIVLQCPSFKVARSSFPFMSFVNASTSILLVSTHWIRSGSW